MNVKHFIYDGCCIRVQAGDNEYTAEFQSWTNDPGIAQCFCSDGCIRLIPSCCLHGEGIDLLPMAPKLHPTIKRSVDNRNAVIFRVAG